MATRQCSEKILNKLSEVMPNLFGGSADLSPSNKSIMKIVISSLRKIEKVAISISVLEK